MDKTTIQATLNQITQEEIPEDMTLWRTIEKQINHRAIRRQRMVLQVARLTAVFVLLSLVAAVGYAVYQRGINDPTIPQEQITPINIELTIEDVTLILDWAYADSHRIGLGYSLIFDQSRPPASYNFTTLTRTDGTIIPQAFGGGGGGGGGSNGEVMLSVLANFDASVIADAPEMLDLILTVQYGGEPPQGQFVPSGGQGGGQGGGGSGGGSGGSEQPILVDPATIPERIYEIAFSVPFIQAVTAIPERAEVVSNGITIHVNEVRIAPSMTLIDLCYNMPDGENWIPRVMLDTGILADDFINTGIGIQTPDGHILFLASPMLEAQQNEAGLWCNTFTAQALFSEGTDRITIVIPYLQRLFTTVTDAVIADEIAFFASQGYDVSIDRIADPNAVNYDSNIIAYPLPDQSWVSVTINTHPEGMDDNSALSAVMSQFLFERYQGSWTFEALVQ